MEITAIFVKSIIFYKVNTSSKTSGNTFTSMARKCCKKDFIQAHKYLKMKHHHLLLFPLIALLSLTLLDSCKKNEEHANEAIIDITSPKEGQMFHQGETVNIKATLTGKEILHGWEVVIRKKSDGMVLFEKDLHVHDLTLTIDESWTNNLTDHTDLVLEVFAQLDHDGIKTSKVVNFHAHP